MILMVTNRRVRKGAYDDEEQPGYGFHCLHDHRVTNNTNDEFSRVSEKVFEKVLLDELVRIRDEGLASTPKVGLYLHGYNNDWQDSVDELVDLRDSLTPVVGYEPLLVGFSWPSSGEVKNYLSDREEVRDSVPAFTRFLKSINDLLVRNERTCFSTSFCIAHSMGNYLLRKGMEYLSDHLGTPVGRKMFDETIMLAPDLSSQDMEVDGKGQYIADFSRRVHVYYSKHDRALKASSVKRFGGNRLGRHGAEDYADLPANVAFVDARRFANSSATSDLKDRRGEQVSVHSSHRYHKEILSDIVKVISSVDREEIEGRVSVPKGPGGQDLSNHFELA